MTPPDASIPDPEEPLGSDDADPRLHLARDWMRHAATDLAAAGALRHGDQFAFVIAFHAQQAVEKALKAFLSWQDIPFRRTHNLEELLDECAAIEPRFGELRPLVIDLTPFAVDTRYPGEDPTPDEATEAHETAREVVEFVRALLPPEPHASGG